MFTLALVFIPALDLEYRLHVQEKSHTLVGPPFALITECILCDIVSTTLCNCYECEWEVKGKDPDARRSEVKKRFIKGQAGIGVKVQAGVRIPESPIQGESKIMNLAIVVLEYARAIREEKIHRWDNLVIRYIQEPC